MRTRMHGTPTGRPDYYEFDSKTRHCKIKKKFKMQCQCNTYLSVTTTIATALLNINDDKQESNSSVTNYSSATDVLA